MAICRDCKQEMLSADSCMKNVLMIYDKAANLADEGEFYERDMTYYDDNERCHDCGIVNIRGNVHHFGCDIERCPRCGGQLISCGCFEGKDITPVHIKMAIRSHD